jgi:hypothetical protein
MVISVLKSPEKIFLFWRYTTKLEMESGTRFIRKNDIFSLFSSFGHDAARAQKGATA